MSVPRDQLKIGSWYSVRHGAHAIPMQLLAWNTMHCLTMKALREDSKPRDIPLSRIVRALPDSEFNLTGVVS